MTEPQTKRYYKGCGVSICPQPVFSYPKGHPCRGCPYIFETEKPSCTMGGTPGDCAWYFYRRLMERPDNPPGPAQVRCARHKAIDDCVEMLCRAAEQKFGREYAEQLRQRRVTAI